ncbi:sigma-70 family RNA polymerase sigma factor [Microcoleus sp. PH2017_05_CCC_O_A]|uniref:RNA polymerase sigma factor n=1 Tax=Microcoleus sp. PH2017_05_CCC_O_A TaxID=2798816 RepID=UPI001D32922C|nr:sigma-70 family RNA polymerase sigma factor [Microcoleus sp. PH2017_05_CCC_O_A]MCC3436508.1 sigma-70 family RNA polymerase sigma factor [Microcoleus sp. PH2017_05_CCC_O_A]
MTSCSQSFTISKQRDCSLDLITTFWQQWQQYRNSLYRCCIKWMGGNFIDAEDALSRAMLKAWEKVQKYAAGEIANFKAWLTKLTHNLCIDIYRERSRGANRVEDIEAIPQKQGLVSFEHTPEMALEAHEQKIVIRRAIDNLSIRLRETFILHFYGELSHQEIAQQQEISYQNVCKRISQARKILREVLRGYFIGEERADTDKSVPPTATESAIGEMSQGNAAVEAIAGETVVSVAVQKVETVVSEELIEVVRSQQQSKSDSVVATADGRLYQIRVKNPLIFEDGERARSGNGEKLARELKKRVSNPDLVLYQFNFIGKQIVGAFPPWLNCLGGIRRGKLLENLCDRPSLLLCNVFHIFTPLSRVSQESRLGFVSFESKFRN